MDFTAIVKSRMQENQVTAGRLAKEMGFTVQYIYKLLKGDKRWNETTMDRACKVLGIKMDFTLDKTDQNAANQ